MAETEATAPQKQTLGWPGTWKSKVLPKIRKIFDKNGTKKAAAAEASKSFDNSQEEVNKEFEEKRSELQPKLAEVYGASPAAIKALVKEPKEAGLKKHSRDVQKFLDELAKIGFPGSKAVSEASSKYGAGLVSGPVVFILEKVSSLVVVEEEAPAPGVETATTVSAEETTTTQEIKEAAAEEEKKEEAEEAKEEAAQKAAPQAEEAEEPPKA